MKIGFYPGCSLNGTSREYNESVKALAQVMGLELIELKDWIVAAQRQLTP